MIPLCTPDIRGKEQEYAADAISSGYLCDGPYLERFADALCDWTGRKHCVLTSSGTAALYVAIRMMDMSKAVVPNWTFVATANAATIAGCEVLLSDDLSIVDIPVDLLGHEADHRFGKVRDSCQSIGHPEHFNGETRPQAVSFNANKMVCAAGGGALFVETQREADWCRAFISQARIEGYDHAFKATNLRMSNIQAAVGLAQMETLGARIGRKKWIHGRYLDAGCEPYGATGSFLYVAKHPKAHLVVERLQAEGIGAQTLWKPLHMTHAYRDAPASVTGYAKEMWQTTYALPCSTWMCDDEISKCAESVASVLGEFS